MNTEHNFLTNEIGELIKNKQTDEANKKRTKVQKIKTDINQLENDLQEISKQLDITLRSIPNIPHESVPVGKDENDNVEIRK
jgi:seryl-tRNA synthetase